MASNSYKNVFVTNIASLQSSGTTTDLGLGEIGIFDANTYVATTTPSFPLNKKIIIAQGTPNVSYPLGVAKANFSAKSSEIAANQIIRWESHKSQLPRNMIVTMGFDGSDVSKTLSFKNGTEVKWYLTMSGTPVANMLGGAGTTHYSVLTEAFELDGLPCLDDCADNCAATYDCNLIADRIIDQHNKRKIIGNQLLSDYVKVTKIVSCGTPSGYATVACTNYTLTLTDQGGQVDLGKVQAQYPGFQVTRSTYLQGISTYSLTKCTAGTPTAFNNAVSPVIPNCTTCPSGYTLNAAGTIYAYSVTRNSLTEVTATTIVSAYGGVTGSGVKLSPAGQVSQIFTFYSTDGAEVAIGTDTLTLIGTAQNLCVINGAVTTAWVSNHACTKAQKTFVLTYGDTPCGATIQAALSVEYAYITGNPTGGVTLVAGTPSGNCTHQYAMVVFSDNVSCETCSEQAYTFTVPPAYNTSPWIDQTGTPAGTDCVCGVKFTSAYVQRERKECFFDEVSYEFEPLFIQLSEQDPNLQDFSQLCSQSFPVTVIQNAQYAQGIGAAIVSEAFKLSRFYFNDPWRTDPATRDAYAYELGVDLNGYYDEFILTFRTPFPNGSDSGNGFGSSQYEEYEYRLFYPAGEGAAFVNAINSYISFPGSTVTPISI